LLNSLRAAPRIRYFNWLDGSGAWSVRSIRLSSSITKQVGIGGASGFGVSRPRQLAALFNAPLDTRQEGRIAALAGAAQAGLRVLSIGLDGLLGGVGLFVFCSSGARLSSRFSARS
jgi:hypothetical protein